MMSPAIHARVSKALYMVERAQTALDDAREALSAVCGLAPECSRIGKLRERVHAEWYRLDAASKRKADKLTLDGMHQDEEPTL